MSDHDVKLSLLGPFRAECGGQRITAFKSNKARALLGYLAVERDTAHHRDVLAGLLWPGSSSAPALLRDVLSNLRLLLGDRDAATPIIRVRADTLQLNPSALAGGALWLDVAAFSDLTADAPREEDLERAVRLYRGDFMDGFALRSTPDFEAWLLLRREVFRRAVLDSLYRLTTRYLQRGDYAAAQATARRQLALDGYSEEAHRQLLRALALGGQRNRALAHYADYCQLLDDELGVAPDVRTTALYQRIRDGRLQLATAGASPSAKHMVALSPSGTMPTPFVGRSSELAWLEARLQEVQRGRGRMVFLTGEPGSGKTMLARAFTDRLLRRADDVVIAGGLCNAQVGAGDPYLPFREILHLLSGDLDVPALGGALSPAYAQRLEAFAPLTLQALEDKGPDLFGHFVPTRSAPARSDEKGSSAAERGRPATAGRRREGPGGPSRLPQSPQALCDQVTRVLRAVSRECVLVLVVDDLQWADEGTLNVLAHLGRRLAGSRILLIGIYRPMEVAPDGALSSVVRELQRSQGEVLVDLDQAGGRAFVEAFLDSSPNRLDAAFREQLTRQTGGHALFTAALVEQMREDGTLVQDEEGRWTRGTDLDWSRLPPRVEAVVAERIARLSEPLRELLAAASVQGEAFTAEVVAQTLERDPPSVRKALSRLGHDRLSGPEHHLVQALGIEQVGGRPVARYRFRHALFQHFLYKCLDPITRAQRHRDVAQALQSLYVAHLDEIAVRLAYHFQEAGLLEAAVSYYTRAGQRAYRLSAPAESVALYQCGLALLEQLPPSEGRDRRELELLLNLEAALMTTRGWGASERIQALQRAYGLGKRSGERLLLLPVLQALASVHIARADLPAALDDAQRLLALGEEASDDLYTVMGQRLLGTAHLFMGHCQKARKFLEAGLRGYSALGPDARESFYVSSAEEGVRLRVWLAYALLLLGYPDQASSASRDALDAAAGLDYGTVKGIALSSAGGAFHATARQPREALRYAEQLLALGTKHAFPFYQAWGTFYRGWGLAFQGQPAAGLPEMRAGLEQLEATGTQASLVSLLTLLAEIYARGGQYGEGQETLQRALTLSRQTRALSYLPEIYRVQGLLRLKEQASVEAEESFLQAVDAAQEQSTRLLELRAVIALARLWADQGRVAKAHDRLSQIYATFTEGTDMPDLVTARALLQRLASA